MKAKPVGFISLYISLMIRRKLAVVLKQFKCNIFMLLQSESNVVKDNELLIAPKHFKVGMHSGTSEQIGSKLL